MMRCSKCKEVKYDTCFAKAAVGLSHRCKLCVNQHRKDNPELYKKYKFKTNLKAKYGLTVDNYFEMLEKQNGGCKICGINTTGARHKTHFSVDHCHITGRIRGLLCDPCNRALGLFKDSHENLFKAAKYLEEYEKNK